MLITAGPDDAKRFSREAVRDGLDLVVAWGGDGTVNGAGTGPWRARRADRDRARRIGQRARARSEDSAECRRALRIAATGAREGIDAGEVDGSLFFNVAGIGFDARIAARLAEPNARRGLLGYVIATISELPGYEPGTLFGPQRVRPQGRGAHARPRDRPRCSSRLPIRAGTAMARRSHRRRGSTTG